MEETNRNPGDQDGAIPPGTSEQPESSVVQAPDAAVRSDRAIFAERWNMFMETFGKRCNELGVKVAIAIVVDPQTPAPHVFYIGDPYDVASLTKLVHGELVDKVIESLTMFHR